MHASIYDNCVRMSDYFEILLSWKQKKRSPCDEVISVQNGSIAESEFEL